MSKSVGLCRSTDDVTPVIKLEDLFNCSRIIQKSKMYKVMLYLPFGLLLLVFRAFVCIFGVLVLSFLPKASHTRNLILRGMCKVLGLVIEVDDKHLDDSVKLLVANHISILDRLAVNAMVPCNSISSDFQIKNIDSLSFWKDDIRYSSSIANENLSLLKTCIEGSSVRVLCFPEETTTNGKVGLLKFHPRFFTMIDVVQPVLINVSMSSFVTVSPSVIGSNIYGDIFWAFFLPSTSYILKVLPSIIKYPEESAEDYIKRIHKTMATALNLSPTFYSSTDKDELTKRLNTSTKIGPTVTQNNKVADCKALDFSSCDNSFKRNSCINENLLSPKVFNTSQVQLSMNTAADTFGKTPKQRMASYQERRAKLVEAAKIKYLQRKKCI